MASSIEVTLQEKNTPIVVVNQYRNDAVLSVRIKGDKGPQTGDVVLTGSIVDDWQPNEKYEAKEVVIVGGRFYRAKVDHISGEIFDPNDGNWEEIDIVDTLLRDFEPNHFYEKDEAVVVDGSIYRAKEDFLSDSTFNRDNWEQVGGDARITDFKPEYSYREGTLITVDQRFFRARKDFVSGTSFDISDWEPIDEASGRNYKPGKYYVKDSIIVSNRIIYRAKQDFVAHSTFDINQWEQIGGAGVGDFEQNTFYGKNSLIAVDGMIYRAKQDFTSGTTFDPNDWEELDKVDTLAEPFKQNYEYEKYEVCVYNNAIYSAKYDFGSGTAFNPVDWEQIGYVTDLGSDDKTVDITIDPDTYHIDLSVAKTIKTEKDRAEGVEKDLQDQIDQANKDLSDEVNRATDTEKDLQNQIDDIDSRVSDTETDLSDVYTKQETQTLIRQVVESTYHFVGFISENEPTGVNLTDGYLWYQSTSTGKPSSTFPWTPIKKYVEKTNTWESSDDYTATDWSVWANYNEIEDDNHPDWYWFGGHWNRLDTNVDLSVFRTAADQDVIDATKQSKLGGTGNGGKAVIASETLGTVSYKGIDTTATKDSQNLIISDEVYKIKSRIATNVTDTDSGMIGNVLGTDPVAGDPFGGDIFVKANGQMRVNGWQDLWDSLDDKVAGSALSTVAYTGSYTDLKNLPTIDPNLYIPAGGKAGQVLGKNSNTDRDVAWFDFPDTSKFVKSVATILPDANGNVNDRVFLTKAEYDALSDVEKQSNKIFVITDYPTGPYITGAVADGNQYLMQNGDWEIPNVYVEGNNKVRIVVTESGTQVQTIPGITTLGFILGDVL